MNKILLLLGFCLAPIFADAINPKKCETLKLSNFKYFFLSSIRLSIDYIIEYYEPRRDDEDSIKKITLITVNDKKTIKIVSK